MTNHNSGNYVGTASSDSEGYKRIELVRATVSKINAQLASNGSNTRYRVSVKGRLGKNNPNALHYRRGGKHWRYSSIDIRPEHSTYFDLYVYRRYA